MTTQPSLCPDPVERYVVPAASLDTSRTCTSVSSDFLNVYSRGDDLDVVQRELRALRYDFAVQADESAAVVVQPVTVAALLIRVEVDSTSLSEMHKHDVRQRVATEDQLDAHLQSCLFDQLDPRRQLSQLVMTA